MKFLAAYLLAHLGASAAVPPGGEEEGAPAPPPPGSPGKADVRRILESVGAEVEEERLDMLFAELEGKDLAELIAAGRERLAYAPCAGAGAAVAAPAAAAGGAAEAKEEEKEEDDMKESDDEGMGLSLFD